MARDAIAMRERLELRERELGLAGLSVSRGMTLLACEVGMLARERILRARVVELWRRRPAGGRMTFLAGFAQRCLVNVFMARSAARLEPGPSCRRSPGR